MNIGTSPNCSPGTEPTALFSYAAAAEGSDKQQPPMRASGFVASCQRSTGGLMRPDPETLEYIKAHAAKEMGDGVRSEDVTISSSSAMKLESTDVEAHAMRLQATRMASNCPSGARPSDATNYNKYTCRYAGVGVDDAGKKVHNPFQTWTGTLASCEQSIDISEQTLRDVQALAWHQADGRAAQLSPEKFACDIASVPSV